MSSVAQDPMAELKSRLKRWPKVDLHRHLEGSLRLETLSEIARAHGIDLPGYEVEAIRQHVQVVNEPYTSRHFLAKFGVLRGFYRTRQVVERVAYEAVADAAADNVRYLELRFTPAALAEAGGFALEAVTQWVIQSVRVAEADHDIRTGLILSMNRHEDPVQGAQIADLAIQYKGEIVGLDLAGDEVAYSALPFAPIFQKAKQAGLGITVHAGEWDSSNNIILSIEHLHADRIGHGVRAIENPEAIRFLRERGVALEVCPTSNLHSGVVGSVSQHPLVDLLDQGLSVTINTDDPSVSGITLTDECALAVGELGLSEAGLKQVILNGARAAFLPPAERAELIEWFQQALVACHI